MNKILEFAINVARQLATESVKIYPAGPHHSDGVLIFRESEKKVLQRCELMAARVGAGKSAM
jgi:hypothetical protein